LNARSPSGNGEPDIESSFVNVIPAKAGIRAPGSRRDLRGGSPLSGDAHPR
jgi:hypothetical protein